MNEQQMHSTLIGLVIQSSKLPVQPMWYKDPTIQIPMIAKCVHWAVNIAANELVMLSIELKSIRLYSLSQLSQLNKQVKYIHHHEQ